MLNNIVLEREKVITGLDPVVIQKYIAGLPGGRTLDLSTVAGGVIRAGHVIIRDKDGVYKPLPTHGAKVAQGETPAVTAGYDAKQSTDTYAGVLCSSISAKDPEAAIMIEGVVCKPALPFPLPADFGLPIQQIEDEPA